MDLTKEELSELNLEAEDIFIHQSRITSYNPSDSSIPILDTCRMDNGGVFPESFEVSSPLVEGDPKAIGFVPSAGAASRYFAPLADLREALQNKSSEELASARAQLKEQGATSWPLPELVKELIQSSSQPSDEMAEKILQIISLPKGLLPATTDKATFLEAKLMEHESITGISGQVFVVKPEKREIFEEVCASYPSKIPAAFLEQGPKFSTIRFNEDGTPYRDSEDRVSIVPAGHGTLVKLFTDAGKKFPNADFLLIRNIDNVMGTSKEILAATEKFLKRHHQILQLVKGIRKNLAARDLDKASEFANEILRFDVTTHPSEMQLAFIEKQGQELKGLWKAYITLFSPPDCAIDESRDSLDLLLELYNKPVNTLGMVPNSGKDVGGTPVYAESPMGICKICLELPHASPEDKKVFLEDPRKATHFNPVFVAAEIPDESAYNLENNPFWIMAKKKYQGKNVCYHEIVLYEILGNNITSNCLFQEIPRGTFNPHKSLADGQGKKMQDYF